jgi:hypothetical protein
MTVIRATVVAKARCVGPERSPECDFEVLHDSTKLVAQLKQLALDGLQTLELGEELEGGLSSQAGGVSRGKHRHRPPKASDLAAPRRSLHCGEASEQTFPHPSATSRQVQHCS